MSSDPRETLANAPMSALQMTAVAIAIGLTALDGIDVLSISFASPGIANEWGIDRAALSIVLSMELFGMAIGSIVLGAVADRIGRRRSTLFCLTLMTIGMFMVTTVRQIPELELWRLLTGIGIGGLLAAGNAIAAEFANQRRRNLCVSLMADGYPAGAVIGGLVIAQLLKVHDWRAVFYFGAAITASFIPLVYLLMPESVHWLVRKQPAGALGRINAALRRMGHEPIVALPEIAAAVRNRSFTDLLGPGLLLITVLTAVAYFLHIITFYFILKWVPKIVADMGFSQSSAAGVLVAANVGGLSGGIAIGLVTQRVSLKAATIGVMLLSTVGVILFGRSPADLHVLSVYCACAGFCTNGAIVGLYAIFAQVFPTHVRASGTGFAIGFGRGGAVLAPIAAGFLFKWGYTLPNVAIVMSLGSVLAAIALAMLPVREDQAGSMTLLSSARS